MYFYVREEFSFDRLYYLCFGIFLNECYVSTLGLYWLFGVVNFNYKKWQSLNLLEVMCNKSYLGDECYVSTLGFYWFFGGVNFNYKIWKSLDLLEVMNNKS